MGLRTHVSNKFLDDAATVAWGPQFENHWLSSRFLLGSLLIAERSFLPWISHVVSWRPQATQHPLVFCQDHPVLSHGSGDLVLLFI